MFEIPRSTLKNKVNSKGTDTGRLINTRFGRKPVLPYNPEEELVSFCQMVDREFFWLVTRTIKQMAFELAIKMTLPVHFQYKKEEQAVSGCVTLCAAIPDWGCAGHFGSRSKGIHIRKRRKIFRHI